MTPTVFSLLLCTSLAVMLFVALRISPPQKLLVRGGHEKPPAVSRWRGAVDDGEGA
jgi:hypothetical protein